MSFSTFGRRLGVTRQAVARAHLTGRLRASVGRDAKKRPVIVDAALAVAEWNENRQRVRVDAPAPVATKQKVAINALRSALLRTAFRAKLLYSGHVSVVRCFGDVLLVVFYGADPDPDTDRLFVMTPAC